MSKRPGFDLSALTAEAATPMQEAAQRTARAVPAPSSSPPNVKLHVPKDAGAVTTANLEALAFKVPPAFRKRFKACALDADLKLNELLFQALDAWEASRKH